MDALKERKNRYFLVSALGALVAFLSFLLLTFITLNLKETEDGVTFSMNLPLTATALSVQASAIWLSGLLALIAFIISCLLIYRNRPFWGQTPAETQAKWGLYGLAGAGVLALLIQYLCVSGLGSSVKSNPAILNILFGTSGTGKDSFASMANGSAVDISATYGIGAWLFLVGMLVVIVGAVLEIVQRTPKAVQTQVPYPQGYVADPYAQGQQAYPPQYPQTGAGQYPPQTPAPTQDAPTGYGYPQYPAAPQQPGQYPSYPDQQPPAGYQ